MLAVIESIASCRGAVNKWNEDKKHRDDMLRAKKEAAAAALVGGPQLTKGMSKAASLLGGASSKLLKSLAGRK